MSVSRWTQSVYVSLSYRLSKFWPPSHYSCCRYTIHSCCLPLLCRCSCTRPEFLTLHSSVLARSLAISFFFHRFHTSFSGCALPHFHSLNSLSLSILYVCMYMNMCCDAFYCWLIWWCWLVDSDIAWLRIQLVIDSLWGCQICWTYLLSSPFSFQPFINHHVFLCSCSFVHSIVCFLLLLL